jgi:CelD/BcsL family acetyltransferase involved in cellulose biosynthesis
MAEKNPVTLESGGSDMDTRIVRTAKAVDSLKDDWDSMVEGFPQKDILLSHDWFRIWAKHFAPEGKLRVAVVYQSRRPVAILPVMEGVFRRRWFRMGILKSLTNDHSLKFDFLATDTTGSFIRHGIAELFRQTGRDVLLFEKIHENSFLNRILEISREDSCFRYIRQCIGYSNRIRINCRFRVEYPFSLFYRGLQGKFRKNLTALEKKALTDGSLELKQPRTETELKSMLEIGYLLESSGWKGRNGTAILQNKDLEDFYTDLAVTFFRKKLLDIYLLERNGKPISFLYGFNNYGIFHAQKIGIDEENRNIGPGMLITKLVLQRLFEKGRDIVYNLGTGNDRWKQDWCNEREKCYNVFIFNNNMSGKAKYFAFRKYVERFGDR